MTTPSQTQITPRTDIFTQARFRYTEIMTIFAVVGELVGILVILGSPELDDASKIMRSIFLVAAIGVDAVLLYRLRQGKGLEFATFIIVVKMIGAALISSGISPYWWFMISGVLSLLTAATVAPQWLFLLTNVIILGQTVIDIANHTFGLYLLSPDESPGYVLLITFITLSVTTRYFTNTTRRATDAANNSARLLRAAAETGQELAKMLNINEILPHAVEAIQERFGFYHVQIFLVDDDGLNARLAASTGAIGQKLFERQHSLGVGSRSVIGTVTSTGKLVIARDTDPFYYRNELLTNTRSELALPIFDGDKIIGALDVQSRLYDSFTGEVIQALQALANQLGTSIRNARLFDEQEKSTRETKRLFLDAETNLREIQRLNQQLTRQGWKNFLEGRERFGGITVDDEHIQPEAEWSEALVEATRTRQPVQDTREGQAVIAVPVMLGSEVIGAIEVESGDRRADAETMEMVQAVAQRLAISLDKARLFEESQEATAREQRINEIVGRYQTVTNVDELLRITLEELSETLGAKRSAIRLGTVPTSSGNGDGHA